jgi:hypothetical protein
MVVEATEKLYGDFELSAKNPGGHSSLPTKDNAIYHVDRRPQIVSRKYQFPFELNQVTRAYFEQMSAHRKEARPPRAADMLAVLKPRPIPPPSPASPRSPATTRLLRTTCVATMLSAGQAPNALPQFANANVNCRILPGHTQEETRQQLIKVFADPPSKSNTKTTPASSSIRLEPTRVSPRRRPCARHLRPPPQGRRRDVSRPAHPSADGDRSLGQHLHHGRGNPQLRHQRRRHRHRRRCAPTPVTSASTFSRYDRGVDFYYRYLQALGGGK